jgi:hypothetical protein
MTLAPYGALEGVGAEQARADTVMGEGCPRITDGIKASGLEANDVEEHALGGKFFRVDLARIEARQFPHAREGGFLAAEQYEHAVLLDDGDGDFIDMAERRALLDGRVSLGPALTAGAAFFADGAEEAARFARGADEGAEFHDGLIPVAGAAGIEHGGGKGFQSGFAGGAFEGEPAREHAPHVAVDGGQGQSERNGADGGGRVVAETREGAQGDGIGGGVAAMVAHDALGGALERTGAAVVAESRPCGENLFFSGASEGLERREALQEIFVIGDDRGDLRLLKHELGDDGTVGRGAFAPGEATTFTVVPGEELAAQGIDGCEIGAGFVGGRWRTSGHGRSLWWAPGKLVDSKGVLCQAAGAMPPARRHDPQQGSPVGDFPGPIRALLERTEVYDRLEAVDLREMAKFGELTNVRGLPMHRIDRPPDPAGLLEAEGGVERLPHRVFRELQNAISAEPQILLRGRLGGSLPTSYPVAVLMPRSAAHVAQAWEAVLWRGGAPEEGSAGLIVIQMPGFSESALLGLPEEGLALMLGTDDPRPGMLVALEWAHRRWAARNELIKLKRLPAGSEPMEVLPGGSFVFEGGEKEGAGEARGGTLVFAGESIPISWEATLMEEAAGLEGIEAAELLLAGAEPWCAAGGGLAGPFWRNPVLPWSLLKGCERWRAAAMHPDALPFGLCVDSRGEIDDGGSSEQAFVIAPRGALPPPFAATVGPYRPQTHYTHRAMKPDAMKLWAMGFPTPEVLGPGGVRHAGGAEAPCDGKPG